MSPFRGKIYSFVVFLSIAMIAIANIQAREAQNNANNNQPLAGLDRMLKQANGVKVDAMVDNKLAANVTNALSEMALNLRKMFVENRRLSQQVQELINRVQNATGVNATNTIANMQQQASNFSGLANNLNLRSLSTMMPRFNP